MLANTLWASEGGNLYRTFEASGSQGAAHDGAPDTALIHGTWARGKHWWNPSAEFHQFLRDEAVFPKLYGGADPFKWSGQYAVRRKVLPVGPVDWDRLQAGGLLAWWAERRLAKPPHLIGHSYGASISLSTTQLEKPINGIVALSPAVHDTCLPNPLYYAGILHVRMKLDLVLMADLSGRNLPGHLPRVTARRLPRAGWLGHTATHDPEVWRANALDEFVRDEWLPGL
jgi:pimeloyl-ACP methyl ester carboxylesterase